MSVIRHNKVFINQILIKEQQLTHLLLQRNKLILALAQNLSHNAIHAALQHATDSQIAVMSEQIFPPARSLC